MIKKITKGYHFEIRHFIILFFAIVCFQILLTVIHNTSTRSLLMKTMDLYRRDFVERVADLTTTSLELLLEQAYYNPPVTYEEERKLIRRFNIVLSQRYLQRNIREICIVLEKNNKLYFVSDGDQLYKFYFSNNLNEQSFGIINRSAMRMYQDIKDILKNREIIISFVGKNNNVTVGVPFVPWGEFSGMVYLRVVPDMRNIQKLISTSYDEAGAAFTAIILFGLLGMFFVSSYAFRERDMALKQLYKEREEQIKAEVERRKEQLFTKKIYHAHHKAEKIMGFIDEDLRIMDGKNLDKVRTRIQKYAKFISRVIYNMKTFEPPVHVIRGEFFQTNVNEVIKFLVDNIFKRVHRISKRYKFELCLDNNFPVLDVNEYVLWEILEPLIQNKIDHNTGSGIIVRISTKVEKNGSGKIIIEDNGAKFPESLLDFNDDGVQKIFEDEVTTKKSRGHSGYGCYISYENCKRCGWNIKAINNQEWVQFIIEVPLDTMEGKRYEV
ncbi:MAG: histidine kinase [Candidatus Neomarinimicrobiota bacterium]|nr:MAG: histidine kinase [Candidatus Neomarinimicrobiota bacterium]